MVFIGGTINTMKIIYDITKDKLNIEKHGLSLSEAVELDLDTALVMEDNRYDYGEKRYNAIGFIKIVCMY